MSGLLSLPILRCNDLYFWALRFFSPVTRSITLYPLYSDMEDGVVSDKENRRKDPASNRVRANSFVKVFLLRVMAM